MALRYEQRQAVNKIAITLHTATETERGEIIAEIQAQLDEWARLDRVDKFDLKAFFEE